MRRCTAAGWIAIERGTPAFVCTKRAPYIYHLRERNVCEPLWDFAVVGVTGSPNGRRRRQRCSDMFARCTVMHYVPVYYRFVRIFSTYATRS